MDWARLVDRLRFALERMMIRGTHYQLLLVALLIALISFASGVIVMLGTREFDSLGEAVWWSFLRLSDPGYLGDDNGALPRTMSTVLTVLGYVIFLGTLVAIMTRWLLATMRTLESGTTPIALKNHVAILGWSGRTPSLVAELLNSEGRVNRFLRMHGVRRLKLAILADDVGVERVNELRERVGPRWNSNQTILRSGSRLRLDHLERIDFLNAAVLLIPADDSPHLSAEEVDSRTIKTLLTLSSHAMVREGRRLPLAVVEVRDARKIDVAREAYPGDLEIVCSQAVISRLIAQNVRHPGLSFVYNDLLTYREGCELYIRRADSLQGRSMHQAAQQFGASVLIGLLRPTGDTFEPHLNPPDDFLIHADDRVVILANDYESSASAATRIDSDAMADLPTAPSTRRIPPAPTTRTILLLGWNAKVPALLVEFATYAHEHFQVDVISLSSVAKRTQQTARLGGTAPNVIVRHIEADSTHAADLESVQPWTYDSIVLVSSARVSTQAEADARTLQGYLLLQHLFHKHLREPARRPNILLELLDSENAELLIGRPGEVMISSLIVSHMLVQIALRRELNVVFEELFTAGGAEITFHAATNYDVVGKQLTFRELAEIARREGETLIGVYQRSARSIEVAKPVINPAKDSRWALGPDDELVTIVMT